MGTASPIHPPNSTDSDDPFEVIKAASALISKFIEDYPDLSLQSNLNSYNILDSTQLSNSTSNISISPVPPDPDLIMKVHDHFSSSRNLSNIKLSKISNWHEFISQIFKALTIKRAISP